ncbi:hypothetical protein [Streptomyces sp. NPDC056713]
MQETKWWHLVHTHGAARIWLRVTAARVGRRVAEVREGEVPF